MGKWVCRYCIMFEGVLGSEMEKWPDLNDSNADTLIAEHLESHHHIPVRRDGESEDDAQQRMIQMYPDIGGPNCKCPECVRARRARQDAEGTT